MLTLTFLLLLARPYQTELAEEFAGDHLGEFSQLRFAADLDGRVNSVIGMLDAGLPERDAYNPEAVAEAAVGFVNKHHDAFGLLGDYELALRPRFATAANVDRFVVHFDQYDGNLRILESEVTVVVRANGVLHSINGVFEQRRDWERNDSVTRESMLERAQELGLSVEENAWAPREDGRGFIGSDGLSACERGVDPYSGSVVWQIQYGDSLVTVSEASGDVLVRDQRDYLSGTCHVTFKDFPRDGAWRATSLANTASNFTDEAQVCDVGFASPYYFWYLRRESSTNVHELARIDDDDSSEVNVVDLIPMESSVDFNATSGSALRQQTAYAAVEQMRSFMLQNVWDEYLWDRAANVEVTMDDDSVGCPAACNSGAYWSDFFTDINVSTNASGALGVYAHEYGHYVVWTYDDVSQLCIAGYDHGDSIDETLANAFSFVFLLDDPDVDPLYAALSTFGSSSPSPHVSGSFISYVDNCSNTPYIRGRAFQQAFWEVLFGQDCSDFTCTAPVEFNGTRVFHSSTISQETVITAVGKSAGAALGQLGENITFYALVNHMVDQIESDFDASVASDFEDVFEHHGF